MICKIIASPLPLSVSVERIQHSVNAALIAKGILPFDSGEWLSIFQRAFSVESNPGSTGNAHSIVPGSPRTPVKPEPAEREMFTPKKWRDARYGDPGKIAGSTVRSRAYNYLKAIVCDALRGDDSEYKLLMAHQEDLKSKLKEDITTAEKDGDHEFLERQFIIDIVMRDLNLGQRCWGVYPIDKGWLAIQAKLRSKTQDILFKGNRPDRNRLNGGHTYAMFTSDGSNLLGAGSEKKRTRNHEFHLELGAAFENSQTRKGFVRRARNIAREFIHPGDEPLTAIAPKNLLFGKQLFTDSPAHMVQAQEKLRAGFVARDKMFADWEAALASGSESEDGLDELVSEH